MASEIKANKLSPATGTDVTLGDSGDTLTVPSGATLAFPPNRNMVINGAMQIAQRDTSEQKQYDSGNGYFTVDRVRLAQGNLDQAVFTMSQDAHLLTGPAGFPNSWKIVTDTAETALASDEHLSFQYNIEANSCQNLAYGTSSARKTTTSFWVKSDVTGTYSLMLYSADASRNIGGTYTIDSADTWEYKTVTFAGDTAGTGINNDTGVGVSLYFALAAGTDRTSADNTSWAAFASNRNAYGQTANVLASATDYWQITGLQFETGEGATPFQHRSVGEEMELCKRYYYRMGLEGSTAYNVFYERDHVSSSGQALTWSLAIPYMRAAPSATVSFTTNTTAVTTAPNPYGTMLVSATSALGDNYIYTPDIELDAEIS